MNLPKIYLPKPRSRKGDNGRLLVIAGSKKYHGSLLYVVKAASRIVDLIYVLSTAENQRLVQNLKGQTAEFIPVAPKSYDRKILVESSDAVLVGPGMGVSKRTYNLVRDVLKSRVKCVLDADALNVIDERLKKLLHRNCILTPHRGEFARLSPPARGGDKEGVGARVRNFGVRYTCTILLKSPDADIVASPDGKIRKNFTGNQGMTKGGAGDVLAGLVAALFVKNDAPTSAFVGAYINGKAGDALFKKVGPFYDAEDLVEQIPKTLWKELKK